jgi:membrane-associated phospholipid phosphatase
MTSQADAAATPAADQPLGKPGPPRPFLALVLGSLSVVVIALSAWLAVRPAAEKAQAGLVLWFNDPPQPFAAIFAAVNPLLRPVPLLVVATVMVGWVLLAAASTAQRLELVRALIVALAFSELVAQVMKRLAAQPRPLWVIPGLDAHGYPTDPHGNAYPSAHTAMAVAAVCALWPWMRWPQRIVGAAFAVLVACNRLYIGAHWPIDIVGGAAIGLLAGTVAWLLAARWPIHD